MPGSPVTSPSSLKGGHGHQLLSDLFGNLSPDFPEGDTNLHHSQNLAGRQAGRQGGSLSPHSRR